jgi:hypothetical protein
MKRFCFASFCGAVLFVFNVSFPATAPAMSFSLVEVPPGPGHPQPLFLWNLDKRTWSLRPPEKFKLLGGAELRLTKDDDPAAVVVCRESTPTERELLLKKDKAGQSAYLHSLLPQQATDVRLISQAENPLAVHGLTNFEAIYAYKLAGVAYSTSVLVSRAGERDYFTARIEGQDISFDKLHNALQRLLATAMVTSDAVSPTATSGQVLRRGMLGR